MSFVETKKKIDAEKAEPIKQYGVVDTLNAGMRLVKIADVPVGVAYSDEDEKNMREALSHFGPLETREQVMQAVYNMQHTTRIATDLRESGMKVEKEFTSKTGKKTFLIDGKIYDESGNIVAE